MSKRLAALASIPLLLAATSWAEEGRSPRSTPASTYQLVLLVDGENRDPAGEREIQAMQERRIAHVREQLHLGVLVVEGPLDGDGPARLAAVVGAQGPEEAHAVLAGNPWVSSGRLKARVHTWNATGRPVRPPSDILRSRTFYLGLLSWSPGSAAYTESSRDTIERAQISHVQRMAERGELTLAGPIEGGGALRGVFVFEARDPSPVIDAVLTHPAAELGRLGVAVYPWHVPAGSLSTRAGPPSVLE